jgi:hypothetical protein
VKRVALSVAALALLPVFADSAEPAPPLDEEFLDYLSDYEGQSDNWTWFANTDAAKQQDKDKSKESKPAAPAQPVKEVKK